MSTNKKPLSPLLRLALEAGPLIVFFVTNAKFGLFVGTGIFMAATAVALVANWLLERRVPVMPLISGAFVLVFGGLTLYLQDELFIKMKPSIVNTLFSGTLLIGLAFGKPLLKPLFGAAFDLDDAGWRKLTFRWALFLALLAVLNEVIWRNFTTDQWVDFKVFAIMPLTLVFTITQMPLIIRHQKTTQNPE